jgi:peptidoglycan-associated lipoprotein
MTRLSRFATVLVLIMAATAACGGKRPPVAAAPPPGSMPAAFPSAEASGDVSATNRPPDPPPIPLDSDISSSPIGTASWSTRSIDEINSAADAPLKPIYFALDSDEISEEAKQVLAANAEVLKTYGTWAVTVEGHSDERGTAEYNLALGDRRARSARNYLISLGIAPNRLRTVSYGKEFPFDPRHTEEAWSLNRRAHFMLTAK